LTNTSVLKFGGGSFLIVIVLSNYIAVVYFLSDFKYQKILLKARIGKTIDSIEL